MIKNVPEMMVSLARDGMTILMVTPQMAFAREIADRVIFIGTAGFFTSPKSAGSKLLRSRILGH